MNFIIEKPNVIKFIEILRVLLSNSTALRIVFTKNECFLLQNESEIHSLEKIVIPIIILLKNNFFKTLNMEKLFNCKIELEFSGVVSKLQNLKSDIEKILFVINDDDKFKNFIEINIFLNNYNLKISKSIHIFQNKESSFINFNKEFINFSESKSILFEIENEKMKFLKVIFFKLNYENIMS